MPWLGFFSKMALAERYVVFDHVQFKKRHFENRNRLVDSAGEVKFVGVPVISKGRYTQAINEVEIDNAQPWRKKLLGPIQQMYRRAPFFSPCFEELRELIEGREYLRLVELNLALIDHFRRKLGIDTPLVYSSDFPVEGFSGSELILELCVRNGASEYLSGMFGKEYLVLDDFAERGVGVSWLDYRAKPYPQQCPEFVPNLSVLDLVFNHGDESRRFL
ncbi:WbqC family protein [Endothiovibrio diazotrophicus]